MVKVDLPQSRCETKRSPRSELSGTRYWRASPAHTRLPPDRFSLLRRERAHQVLHPPSKRRLRSPKRIAGCGTHHQRSVTRTTRRHRLHTRSYRVRDPHHRGHHIDCARPRCPLLHSSLAPLRPSCPHRHCPRRHLGPFRPTLPRPSPARPQRLVAPAPVRESTSFSGFRSCSRARTVLLSRARAPPPA